MTQGEQITVDTLVACSPEKAWDVYTSPDSITQWNHASPDWHCPSAEVDLREGGRHFARMEARDGSSGFDFVATYEEVDAPNSLTMRLDDGRRSRTTFVQESQRTRVTTVFEAEDTNPVEMQRDGWQSILDCFAAYAERT